MQGPNFEDDSFHQPDQWYIAKRGELLERAVKEKTITEHDAELIRDFIAGRSSKICAKRSLKYAYILVGWRKSFLKTSYHKMTYREFNEAVEAMRHHGYKLNTQRDYLSFFKRFTLWMVGRNLCAIKKHSNDYDELQEMSPGKKDTMTKTVDDLFTKEEILAMIQAAPLMYRVIITMLYDGALRPIEMGKLRWRQIKFYEHKAVINVNEKTGKVRKIPLYTSYPYLKAWRNEYPGEVTPDSRIFLNERGNKLTWFAANKNIKIIAAKAGIKRKVRMYDFRHTKITDLRRNNIGDGIISRIAWGSEKSEMLSTYSHLCDDDTDAAIAEYEGIDVKTVRKKQKALEARQCPECGGICGATMAFCPDCGNPVTREAMDEKTSFDAWLREQPEYKNMMNMFEKAMEMKK